MALTQDQARSRISELVEKYNGLTAINRKLMTEASVVHQFLDPLFEALNWPTKDPARYKYEQHTQVGRPDMMLFPEQGGILYVEAKRFEAIKELAQSRKTITGIVTPGQLSLPSMAADRTREEQQAINYAFENGGTWAILTNFERLRLFNARRDWLVLSFERPIAYLEQFDLLWQLSYERVCSGDLDRLSNQRHREDVDTDYLAFINEWRERLAQDIIARPEANPWAFDGEGNVKLADLRAVVQRILDRLVVVRFAEDHLIAPAGTLHGLYELCTTNPYTFSLSEFFQRLYRRFDEYHNSALFAPHLADHAVFGDDVLAGLIEKLYEARYRAMSADIMGNTYEQYLGKTLIQSDGNVVTADNLETRKKQGSYYTPQVIVRYLVDNSLGRYLYATENGQPDGEPLDGERPKTAAEICHLHVLDPACGSGSFLIYAYEVLAGFYRREIARVESEIASQTDELATEGMSPIDIRIELSPLTTELARLQDYPRLILETHLYGVDLDPQAAEIATVNLVMRAMADRRSGRRRLPLILNQNVKVGNSLIGAGPDDPRYAEHAADLAELRRLRLQLAAEEHTTQHDEIFARVGEIAGRVTAALDEPLAGHFADVNAHRPFYWAVEFPEVFLDETGQHKGDAAGFDVVVGNPPWEIVKPNTREFFAFHFDPDLWGQYSRKEADDLIAELLANNPKLSEEWESYQQRISETTSYCSASSDYQRQGKADTNTYKLFLERSYDLLRDEGELGLVIPSGIYTDLGTRPLRELLLFEGRLEYLYSFANNRKIFPDIHPSFRFVLLNFTRAVEPSRIRLLFRVTVADAVSVADFDEVVADTESMLYMSAGEIQRLSPRNLVFLEIKDLLDIEVLTRIYTDVPPLGEVIEQKWNLSLANEFHMTNHRTLFNQQVIGWPLYEARMIDQFDHRVAYWVSGRGRSAVWRYSSDPERFSNSYPWRAQYYIDPQIALERQVQKYGTLKWRAGLCMVTAPTNRRTVIASMLPMESGVGNSITTVTSDDDESSVLLYSLAIMNSFAVDYAIRFRIKLNFNFFIILEIPLPRLTAGNPFFDAIVPRAARLTCTTAEFADLWQEVMVEPWDETKGATDPAERQVLRDELDALVAHLYGLSREDFWHILGTFPLVFPDDEEGRARKEALLAVYDRFGQVTKDWKRQ